MPVGLAEGQTDCRSEAVVVVCHFNRLAFVFREKRHQGQLGRVGKPLERIRCRLRKRPRRCYHAHPRPTATKRSPS